MRDALTVVLLISGALFFTAGTVGVLRFPDTASRLHALTKADNVGLGLLMAGLAVHAEPAVAAKLALIWVLVLLSSTTTAQLLAAREAGLTEAP
jgi:multicomponent Na+:H+ antiporter subunit G